jgi:hypothetical protein
MKKFKSENCKAQGNFHNGTFRAPGSSEDIAGSRGSFCVAFAVKMPENPPVTSE